MIAELETVPATTVPAVVTVAEPMVVGVAQVVLVPHSYIVMVGFPVQENCCAAAEILSTVLALLTL